MGPVLRSKNIETREPLLAATRALFCVCPNDVAPRPKMSLPSNRAVHFAPLSLTRLPLLRANPLRCHDASVLNDSAVVAELLLQTTASQTSLDAYELCFARPVGCLPIRSASACFRRAGKPAIRLLWPQSRPTSASGSLALRSRGLVSVELMAPPHLFSGSLCVRFAWARRG